MRRVVASAVVLAVALTATAWVLWPSLFTDLSGVRAHDKLVWRGKPVFVHHRTPAEIERSVKRDGGQ